VPSALRVGWRMAGMGLAQVSFVIIDSDKCRNPSVASLLNLVQILLLAVRPRPNIFAPSL
jgi:hypothetical protein